MPFDLKGTQAPFQSPTITNQPSSNDTPAAMIIDLSYASYDEEDNTV